MHKDYNDMGIPNCIQKIACRYHPIHPGKILNKQHIYKRVRVDKYSVLEKSTDVTNLLVNEYKISTETTVGDASWININN